MLKTSLKLLALVLSATYVTAAPLPEASRITEGLLQETAEVEQDQLAIIDFAGIYAKKAKETKTAEERVKLWLDTYKAWGRTLKRNNDWNERERLEQELQKIGRYFPGRSEWPILAELIEAPSSQSNDEELKSLRFILALLQADEAAALKLLPQEKAEPETPAPTGKSGIFGALLGISTSSSFSHHEPLDPIFEVAVQENSMPALQRKAYGYIIRYIEKNNRNYYGHIPDLTGIYEGEALDYQVGRLVESLGDNLRPYSLPRNMIAPVFAYMRANDIIPNEEFLNYLDQTSSTYGEDLAYFHEKRAGLPKNAEAYQALISKALKSGDVDEAWKQWEAFATADPKQAGNFIQSIYGYQRRNFDQDALRTIALRLLEISETPNSLELLQGALPLDAGKKDPLLLRIRKLKASAEDDMKQVAYAKLELDRILSLGLRDEVEPAARALINRSDAFIKVLISKDQSNALINYAKAFDLIEMEGLAEATVALHPQYLEALEANQRGSFSYQSESFKSELASYYADRGEDKKAFEFLRTALDGVTLNQIKQHEVQINDTLAQLLGLYAKHNQHADVVHLLDHAIGWNAIDLKEIYFYSSDRTLQVDAAVSLHAVGRTEDARRILRDYLSYVNNSEDRAYKALVEIEGTSAAEFFKKLAEVAPFEERPLIWQAVLLHQSGQLDAAEKMARQAISIDPTDGEMGATDRLRAYAVLADILKAQNDDEAEVFKNIVAAVDLSEIADEYRVAGLHMDALELYEESLNLFADAYCVRFRAAVELEAAGQHEEAEKHFEAAYTLMPDQFGRIESHCFGCEGAFEGKRAVSIAERVFTRMLKDRPELPSLHYLMGYLNNSRKRPEDALNDFQMAVKLDPLYYNAWAKINDLAEDAGRHELALQATQAMLEIAPARTIDAVSGLSISQVGHLWETLDQILPILPERSASIYRLEASAKLLEESELSHYNTSWQRIPDYQAPGSLLFENHDVTQLLVDSHESVISIY